MRGPPAPGLAAGEGHGRRHPHDGVVVGLGLGQTEVAFPTMNKKRVGDGARALPHDWEIRFRPPVSAIGVCILLCENMWTPHAG